MSNFEFLGGLGVRMYDHNLRISQNSSNTKSSGLQMGLSIDASKRRGLSLRTIVSTVQMQLQPEQNIKLVHIPG